MADSEGRYSEHLTKIYLLHMHISKNVLKFLRSTLKA